MLMTELLIDQHCSSARSSFDAGANNLGGGMLNLFQCRIPLHGLVQLLELGSLST